MKESVSANKKLQADDAREIAEASTKMVVMKGKKVDHFDVGAKTTDEAVTAMLGATGNMRAPLQGLGSSSWLDSTKRSTLSILADSFRQST